MPIVFTIINHKGGTGKTTSALHLATYFSRQGYRTLAVDLDSQRNLSIGFGIRESNHHIGTLLLSQSSFEQTLRRADSGVWLLPSNRKLLTFEYLIANETERDYFLKDVIADYQNDFDYVFIDCAPSLGALSINALVAADYYIVPMQAENFAFIGLDTILETASVIQKRMNPKLKIGGVLLTRFDHRTQFGQSVIQKINEDVRLKDKTFQTPIRQDIALMECTALGTSVFDYAPKSRGAQDYEALALELLALVNPQKTYQPLPQQLPSQGIHHSDQ